MRLAYLGMLLFDISVFLILIEFISRYEGLWGSLFISFIAFGMIFGSSPKKYVNE